VHGVDVLLRGGVPAVTPRRAPVVVALALLAMGGAACRPRYEPPLLTEPHATAKLRIAYHHVPPTTLEQLVLINGHVADVPPPVTVPGEVSRAIPLRLEGTGVDVRTSFYHMVTTYQTRTETYVCSTTTYPCGNSTCTRSETCTRTVTVPVTVRVSDGQCAQAAGLGPQRDGVYLLQYDYYDAGRCSLACLREWPQPDGTFRNSPCEPPPPP
jgi:hypothetical protein